MMFSSKNMSYIYYHEYFEGLEERKGASGLVYELGGSPSSEEQFRERNMALQDFKFDLSLSPLEHLKHASKGVASVQTFSLETIYPGLMIGTGNPHDLKSKGSIYSGFSFDYVTGLPYIPGSSVKGVLKSVFPRKEDAKDDINQQKMEYIKSLLKPVISSDEEIYGLKDNIFEDNDVFLDAYPTSKNKTKQQCLALEFITPHSDIIKNPIPINCLKVKPGISFEFGFYLNEYKLSDEVQNECQLSDGVQITVEEKIELFKTILTDVGIGAKTNVGFGQLE
ncbi:CRISPR-associated RAMP protein, Cmr6 family [Streptococcus sp. oral taxon 058 str. F0407]|uniref:type III-B CRISPR module RAMP protein Cmr6 n=1 Tax=Streptococcus sp. oral taxon 058 TaxID=712622 RepID=UPI000234A785|nr:type III-B CRISPR module RAMP protein Cmr6 [Streptococcus sp. oral taxon 058]EHI76530.1 CRISPR-associated RAMP protein, Cmr6 family [Streptococcus sp. oral taxon 058 str. F0407]